MAVRGDEMEVVTGGSDSALCVWKDDTVEQRRAQSLHGQHALIARLHGLVAVVVGEPIEQRRLQTFLRRELRHWMSRGRYASAAALARASTTSTHRVCRARRR